MTRKYLNVTQFTDPAVNEIMDWLRHSDRHEWKRYITSAIDKAVVNALTSSPYAHGCHCEQCNSSRVREAREGTFKECQKIIAKTFFEADGDAGLNIRIQTAIEEASKEARENNE